MNVCVLHRLPGLGCAAILAGTVQKLAGFNWRIDSECKLVNVLAAFVVNNLMTHCGRKLGHTTAPHTQSAREPHQISADILPNRTIIVSESTFSLLWSVNNES